MQILEAMPMEVESYAHFLANTHTKQKTEKCMDNFARPTSLKKHFGGQTKHNRNGFTEEFLSFTAVSTILPPCWLSLPCHSEWVSSD